MIEISQLESKYVRSLASCPDTVIYRTTHSKYLMSEEYNALTAIREFRKLSIKEQENLLKEIKRGKAHGRFTE